MKLAFSTNAFTRYTLEQAIESVAEIGFDGVEILVDSPHLYPPTFSDEQVEALSALLRRTGLGVSNLNANCTTGYFDHGPPEPFFEPSLISPREDYRRDRQAMIDRTLRIARRLGAANISITSGRLLSTVPPHQAQRLLREGLARVLQSAEETGVKVGIECEPGLFIEWVLELKGLIDDMGSPLLGANLDVGHSFVAGEDLREVIDLLGGRIWNLHVEDIRRYGPAKAPKHYHLVPGLGDMNFRMLCTALKRSGYEGYVTVELYTYADAPELAARQSLEYLRREVPEAWEKGG